MPYGEINQTDVLDKLSFLEGNQTTPSSGIDDWKAFIQSTLEEAWIAYPWSFVQTTQNLVVTNGTAAMPSDILPHSPVDIRKVNSGTGDDNVYVEVPYGEQDDWDVGDYRYWLTGESPDLTFNTKESPGTLTIQYTPVAPTLSSTTTAPFPDPMVIALGAQRFIRKAENPQADISQEEAIFQNKLEGLFGAQNRSKPRKARRFYSSVNTGQVGGD